MNIQVEIAAAIISVLLTAVIAILAHVVRRLERLEITLALVKQRLKIATGESLDTNFYKP